MAGPISFGLGLAIGKAAFKAWFKDNEFASSLTDDLAETIGKVIPDWKACSTATRQMERISEKAAEALEILIENEWRDLPRGEITTAIYQAQSAINNLNINSRILAETEYDPQKLHDLLAQNIDISMLNESARHLALRLCDESSQLIVDLSSSLPEFQREALAEILKRESTIMDSVDKIFEEISNIRKEAQARSETTHALNFEQTYRRATARKLDRIELFGLNSAGNKTSRQHNLSTAYISLSVTAASLEHNNDNEQKAGAGKTSKKDTSSVSSIRAEEAAAIAERVVIKGEAGSGKTTLLQSIAVRCAAASFVGDMEHWNSFVPFFIPLRSISAEALPPPEDFPKTIASNIAGTMPAGWVHEQLQQGRGLLLIDGLDEISEQRRESTRRWIEDLLEEYPDCRVLITSRPPAIPDGWLAAQDFTEIELLPMSPDDVSMFIEHWHEAVAGEEQEQSKIDDVRKLSGRLRERIRLDRALRELASSPLLCAMLCAMNRDRRQVLPSNRISLYEAATQLILHGRDEQRQVKIDDLPALDFETKRDLLQDVAFWMMENGLSMADEWRVIDLVSNLMPRFPRLPAEYSAPLLVKALLQRSGILRSPVDGKCDFIHNAFKEYLCARAVSDGDRFGFLEASVSNQEAWREVAPMAAAITDDKRRTNFLEALLEKGDKSRNKRVMYHLLAVRCLETCTQLNPEIQEQIKTRISGLRRPDSIAEAKALSAAGDLAINLLRKPAWQYARTAASCVRTLRLIGSNEALDVLETYGNDTRGTVIKELLAAWPFFDRKEYARRVLSKTRLWGGLRVDNVEGLEGIGFLSMLQSLHVNSPRRPLTDAHFEEISALPKLENLTIKQNDVLNVNLIGSLANLTHLNLSSDVIVGLEKLNDWESLSVISLTAREMIASYEIDLRNAHSIQLNGSSSIPPIVAGENLHSLIAHGVAESSDISFIESSARLRRLGAPLKSLIQFPGIYSTIAKLHELFIYEMETFDDIEWLKKASSLKTLTLHNCHNLHNLNFLSDMSKLQKLSLFSDAKGLSLSPLENCKEIRTITLAMGDENLDLEPLSALPSLAMVYAPSVILRKLRETGLEVSYRAIPSYAPWAR